MNSGDIDRLLADVNREGDVVIHKVGARAGRKPDRFEAARGKANVEWRTDDLMALLRGEG